MPEINVALVLGAAAYPAYLSDILIDRMETAIELYETEKVQKLINFKIKNIFKIKFTACKFL